MSFIILFQQKTVLTFHWLFCVLSKCIHYSKFIYGAALSCSLLFRITIISFLLINYYALQCDLPCELNMASQNTYSIQKKKELN